MKKRIYFLGAIFSLIPIGQPLLIKTSLLLSNVGLILSFAEKSYANPSSYFNYHGYQKSMRGDYYGAISDYSYSIEIDSNNADAYYNRGNARVKIKDYHGAISDYSHSIEISPASDAYYNRGVSKGKLKDYYGAISDYTKAI